MKRSTVAIARDDSIEASIRRCLDTHGGLAGILKRRHVVIKPNDTWASPADHTACTQADSLRAVIRYIKRFAPRKITVSGGAGAAETDDVFHYLGLDTVIAEEKVEYFDHNRPPFRRIQLKRGEQREVMINPYLLAYETVISLAQLKVHYAAQVTLTLKNIALSYPAADYYGHPRSTMRHPHAFFKDLDSFIAAMAQRFPPALGIIVGHPAMVRAGPVGGDVFDTGLTIAGRDCVAVDYVGAQILGVENVRHIRLAEEYGMGTAQQSLIDIVGLRLAEARDIVRQKAEQAGIALEPAARR